MTAPEQAPDVPAAATPLAYAGKPRRRRWRGSVVVLVVLIAAAFAGWKWGRPYWHRGKYLYEQRAILRLTLPPDKVVYDEDPARARLLLANPAEYRASQTFMTGFEWRNGPPPGWQAPVNYRSAQWLAFRPGDFYDGVLFVSGRRSAGEKTRIVFVSTHTIAHGPNDHSLSVMANPYVPASWRLDSKLGYPRHTRSLGIELKAPQSLRIYAGQKDPADDSHFTLRYDINGIEGTIDGWLRDVPPGAPTSVTRGDDTTVVMAVRDGPLKGQAVFE